MAEGEVNAQFVIDLFKTIPHFQESVREIVIFGAPTEVSVGKAV